MTVGFVLGKFRAFHKGHELLLSVAASQVNHLIVLVSDREPSIMIHHAVSCFVKSLPCTSEVIIHKDCSPKPKSVDKNGTVLDEDFQHYWKQEINKYAPSIDFVFTSDQYGQLLANNLKAKWIPVDPNRDMFPISSTEILNDLDKNWHYLSDFIKPDFAKTIAIVGPESVGKSTIVEHLANYYKIPFVSEYGRVLSAARNNALSEEDFYIIYNTQRVMIKEAAKHSRLVITDTEGLVTALYGQVYLGNPIKPLLRAGRRYIDHYFVIRPSKSFVQDGTRVMNSVSDRVHFTDQIINHLDDYDYNYSIIEGTSITSKLEKIKKQINRML